MAIHLQAKASFHVAFVLDKQAQKGQHDVQAKASFLGATILVAPKAWMELSCHGCNNQSKSKIFLFTRFDLGKNIRFNFSKSVQKDSDFWSDRNA